MKCLILVLGLFALVPLAMGQWQGTTPEELEVAGVIESYYSALNSGDTNSIRGLIGKDLLAERGAQLSNPDYGRFLRDLYTNSRAEILDVTKRSDGAYQVSVQVHLDGGNQMQNDFILSKDSGSRYVISSELE